MKRRPRLTLFLVGFMFVAGAIAAVVLLRGNSVATQAAGLEPLNFAEVVTTDLAQEETFDGTLGSVEDEPITTHLEGIITAIAEPGETISQGDPLLAINDRPVVLLYGGLPAYRTLLDAGPNLIGPDVRQLEEALVALGYDPNGTVTVDDEFTFRTRRMVRRWQQDVGLEDDGIVDLGEVVFLDGEARVTGQLVAKGNSVGGGSAVLEVSRSKKVVRIDLPADKQGSLTAGGAVTVEMPDSTEVPATVISVSKTAVASQDGYGPATFEVLVELDNPAVAANLDEAPVDVIVVSDSVKDVKAVPVSALVALLEGGYAVEVDAGSGRTRFVAVEVGFFGSNNMIEIKTSKLRSGDQVLVP